MINYISHKKSKQIVNGLPKLPTSDQLKEGEIAINYANGYETLSIKNSENKIITFSSTEQFEKYVDTTLGNKLGSGFTGENSANTVTSIIEENEKIASASLNDLNERKLDASAYTPTDLSDYYKKEETSGKTELDTALASKANTADLTAHTGKSAIHITSDERTKWNGKISNVQYNKTDKKIYFYSGATTETPMSNIDVTDFIKDGMVSNVEIKDVTNSGSCLVITFNVDSGKENIVIPVSKIFNSNNYYLKSETSGKTELRDAFNLKANASDLTTHTSDSTIHITAAERTKWNNAATNSHTHANKSVLDTITAIDTELSETSNNLVVNSAITKVIQDNEKISSAALNDLKEKKLDVSAYTPTDLSDYYKKEETSGKTELENALKLKANATDLSGYYKKAETSGKTELDTAFGLKANTSDLTAHTSNSTIHITSDERTKWNNASASSHTHANKSILDSITAIDIELSETSNNLVVNSAITKVIEDNEKIASAALNDLNERKLDASAYTPTDLSDYYKKEETSGKTELDNALKLKANSTDVATKANTADLTAHTGNSAIHITADERTKWNGKIANVQYNKTNKKIYFYSGATTETPISNIDATDFIKDGMVSNVEIKDVANSGSCLVITFNADAGKQNIVIPVSKIFNPANYYLKSETSGKTEISTALNLKANTSDLSNYYKKTETSGSTQLTTALNSKANATDLTAHTGNSTIHITSDERTKWNNASTNSHTHANKAVLDTITAIDKELSETSNNLVVNSAITAVILANERIASSSLNDLNERKLDASAYTPTDLSNYYKKAGTSGKTELNTAFGLKANASDLASHTGNTTAHVTAAERTKWNGKISTAQYNKADKKINFYSGATTETPVSSIDATDFIKDGMVSNVEIKDVASSGSCLVITFNSDAGKQNITIPISKIFNSSNYYLKSETSGKTEISTALDLKANTTDLTAHTGNSTIHITTDERTKWNNAVASSHTHANKAVLDSIAAIDTELSETSNNLVVNSAITKVIEDNEKIVSASLNDLNERKLDASAYTPTDLSDYYKKEETSGKTELSTAFGLKANSTDVATKANTADLTAHTGNSAIHITADERTKWNGKIANVQYNKTDKKIYFYSGATTETPISNIDATDFIKDGMVSNVEIKDVASSGSCLVITFNADAGKQDITIPVTKIFNPKNYYLKTETSGKTELDTAFNSKANASDLTAHTGDSTVHITSAERTKWNDAATSSHTHANKAVLDTITAIDKELSETSNNLVVNSAITTVILANEKITSSSLNDLNEKKLDVSAYTPTDLSDYYKKEETSGKTELNTALGLKANTTDLTAHTGNSTIHITADERTKWNNAATSSHTHANKAVLDKITAIDTELSETSNNLVVNSAITKVILDDEKTVSASLNELNERKLDASAYTPTDLSDYYKKEETSGKTEISTALSSKANTSDLSNYYKKTETSGSTQLTTAFNSKANTSHRHLSKDITDKVTAITESNSGSTSVPTVSAVTKVIRENEEAISSALNDLNKRINQLNALIKNYEARIKALESK